MDVVLLARIKFAMTAGFHFIFPPLTIGLSWLIVWMMGRYHKTGDEAWGRTVRFWLRMFAVTFALGVVTGLTLEFQFGTNWSKYSRFVGDIFGAPLAAEGIFSFFLEYIFDVLDQREDIISIFELFSAFVDEHTLFHCFLLIKIELDIFIV